MKGNHATIKNHCLSRFFSNNFRVNKGEPMWLLDCNSGKVTNRKTREDFLFMKANAWGQTLENSFGTLENMIKPLIDSILNAPYSPVSGNLCVNSLSNKCNIVFSYLLQTTILQFANSSRTDISPTDELMIGKILEEGVASQEESYLVRYNHRTFADTPLILIDNAVSIYVTPPINSNSDYSVCYIMPISPYYLLFGGSRQQLDFFLFSKHNPHIVNINRILTEDKKCLAASQNEQYIKWLAKEYQYYQFDPLSGAIPTTRREYI